MRSLKRTILSLFLVGGIASPAAAQQVNFDDLAGLLTVIDSPYAGFNWNDAFVVNPGYVFGLPDAGGFGTALSSGNRVLGNSGGRAMTISGSTFNLMSGVFAAAWTTGLNLNVKGFSGATELYNQNYTLDWFTASHLDLNLLGVDRAVFTTSGGTIDLNHFDKDSNQSFGADNLEFVEGNLRVEGEGQAGIAVVPEPMTVSLMAAGLLVLGGVQSRRRRTAQGR